MAGIENRVTNMQQRQPRRRRDPLGGFLTGEDNQITRTTPTTAQGIGVGGKAGAPGQLAKAGEHPASYYAPGQVRKRANASAGGGGDNEGETPEATPGEQAALVDLASGTQIAQPANPNAARVATANAAGMPVAGQINPDAAAAQIAAARALVRNRPVPPPPTFPVAPTMPTLPVQAQATLPTFPNWPVAPTQPIVPVPPVASQVPVAPVAPTIPGLPAQVPGQAALTREQAIAMLMRGLAMQRPG